MQSLTISSDILGNEINIDFVCNYAFVTKNSSLCLAVCQLPCFLAAIYYAILRFPTSDYRKILFALEELR